MSFKTILVAMNDVSRTDALLSAALTLAAKHEAHVIGLYVIPAVRVYPAMSAHVTPAIDDAYRAFFGERSAATKKAFEQAVRKEGTEAEWREIDSSSVNIADGVIAHGFQADLIIAPQQTSEGNTGIEADFCERIVMESGRPVLIIPATGSFAKIGENVIVGWNATREAARAVMDAVPLLQNSSETRLIWVDPQKESGKSGNLPGAEMAASLARHGVKAVAEALPTDGIGAGNSLLNRAADVGADLIVVGAYGHSRMREFVFGGATRTMLENMTVPVLMSH